MSIKASFFEGIHKAGDDVMYMLTGQKTPPKNTSMKEKKFVEHYRAMDEAASLNIQTVGNVFT